MSDSRKLIIAIDGPAGSGKSTIAARLARKLGYINLESGAMYRALALKALEQHVPLDNPQRLSQLARHGGITLQPTEEGNRVLLDGRDVSQRIREVDVTAAASQVSVHPAVRAIMVARQRELGENGGVVVEGRDIGTAVFPQADVKVFLMADPQVRAERRIQQNGSLSPEDRQRVIHEMVTRDERDRSRATSPLVAAPDAITLDSTNMTIDQVVEAIGNVVAERKPNVQRLSLNR